MRKLFILFIAAAALLSSCIFGELIIGSGNIISETRTVGTGYSTIEFNAVGNVVLTNDPVSYVTLTGDDNVIDEITVYSAGDTLYIETDPYTSFSSFTLTLIVPVQNPDTIISGGAGNISADHIISPDSLTLVNSGAGNMDLVVNTNSLGCEQKGAGNIELSGSAGYFSAGLPGSGNIEAQGLLADSCFVNLSGAGNIEVSVQNSITGNLSGVGNIFYWGNPLVHTISVTGFGHVHHM